MTGRWQAFRRSPLLYGIVAALLLGFAVYVVPALPFVPKSEPELKFSVIDTVGRPLVCTGWGMPNARFNAYGQYPLIVRDVPTYLAIVRRLHLPPTPLSNDQIVAVYREWLDLNGVRLKSTRDGYDFEMFPGPTSSGLRYAIVGKVDVFGRVYAVRKGEDMGACPICLAADANISTPNGPIQVSRVTAGMHVWSRDAGGRKVDSVVLATAERLAAPGSKLVRVVLADGRRLTASAVHPLADGRSVGSLRAGDLVDGVAVVRVDLLDWSLEPTYDLLPSGMTGVYWVDGIPVRSTLAGRRPTRLP